MNSRGKSIQIYLMDSDANGRMKCTLANWTGVAYKIPRTELDKCKDREDLKQSGVYFLFGTSDQSGEHIVYIGQARARKNGEGLLNRLQEHKRNLKKDYWTEAIAFTTSNNSLGPTDISYLENRFCNLALLAKRYVVKNGNDPSPGNITEEKESELEEFVDNAQIIMGTLGNKIFIPVNSVSIATPGEISGEDEPLLSLNTMKVKAIGRRTREGFVVLKSSEVSPIPTNSCPETIRRLREQHASRINPEYVLTEDIQFGSPSSAVGFVTYGSANGLVMWMTNEGKTLRELESDENTK